MSDNEIYFLSIFLLRRVVIEAFQIRMSDIQSLILMVVRFLSSYRDNHNLSLKSYVLSRPSENHLLNLNTLIGPDITT